MKTLSSIISLCILSLTVTGQIVPDTFSLPFVERFTTGMIETNGWTIEGSNWQVAGQDGNSAPINVSDYTPGIYLMRFSGNKVILEKKLVIQ